MQTVDKAMKLLGFFSVAEPEIGLSDLARLASLDKAATRRFLVALAKHGFIEQDATSRRYRLGSAFLRFARIREATRPLASVVQGALTSLMQATGETAHASLLSGDHLATIGIAEPQRPTRVSVDPAQPLPLYATASGLACLAFADEDFVAAYLERTPLKKLTEQTLTGKRDLKAKLAETRQRGYSLARGSFEADVISIAVPLFDAQRRTIGALAVASIASRFSEEAERRIAAAVLQAGAETTEATGGAVPADVAAARGRQR
jgi:IclR family acetate operon transcriptional repressor